jgi:hypothetical protein
VSYNTGAGPATQGNATTQVQLHQPTGLVRVLGHDVKPEVLGTMKTTSPELFIEPEAKAAQAVEARPKRLTKPAQRRSPARTSTATPMMVSKLPINTSLGRSPLRTRLP